MYACNSLSACCFAATRAFSSRRCSGVILDMGSPLAFTATLWVERMLDSLPAMPTDADALRAYKAARARFVFDEIEFNDERHARVTDPETGLSLHCSMAGASLLLHQFRGRWIDHHLSQHSC